MKGGMKMGIFEELEDHLVELRVQIEKNARLRESLASQLDTVESAGIQMKKKLVRASAVKNDLMTKRGIQ